MHIIPYGIFCAIAKTVYTVFLRGNCLMNIGKRSIMYITVFIDAERGFYGITE